MEGSHPDAANYRFMYELCVCVCLCVKEHRTETRFVLLLQKVMLVVDFSGSNSLMSLCAAEFTCMEIQKKNRTEQNVGCVHLAVSTTSLTK